MLGQGKRLAVLATLIVCGAPAGSAWAGPGDLDHSFGSGTGWSRINFGALVPGAIASDDRAEAMALQPDGKIVLAGYSNATGGNDFAVVRLLNPQGTLDTSYGLGTGGSRVDFGGLVAGATASGDRAEALALQPDGKIVVAGYSNAAGSTDFAVVRLNSPQGTLDGSYGLGTGGSRIDWRALLPGTGPSTDSVTAVALQPDGKIVVAGSSNAAGSYDFAVARLKSPQGTLDSTYGQGTGASRIDMRALVPGTGPSSDFAQALAFEPDGKIVIAGYSDAAGTDDFAVVRLNSPKGTLDSSFGTGGAVLTDFGSGGDTGRALAMQGDGKILVAGTVAGSGGISDVGVARYQPNGTLDSTFGKGGKAIIDLGANDVVRGLALQRDGRILVAGRTGTGTNNDMFVVRLAGDPGVSGGGGGGGGGGPVGGGGAPPRCAGRRATIVGTNGKDRLRGTRKADVIVALGGNDTIAASRGNDIVCAGNGNDRIDGSTGNDRLYGQNGKDTLTGDSGNDTLDGGDSNDRIGGGGGKDKLLGGTGNDRLDGGPGNDRLSGQSGKDKLLGRSGRDRLNGGPGRDTQHQ